MTRSTFDMISGRSIVHSYASMNLCLIIHRSEQQFSCNEIKTANFLVSKTISNLSRTCVDYRLSRIQFRQTSHERERSWTPVNIDWLVH